MIQNGLNKPNVYKASSFIKSRSFLGLLIFFFIARIVFLLHLQGNPAALASDLTPASILEAVNYQRGLRNLVILNPNSKLTLAAQSKADDMQARHYFAHIDPDGHYIWDKIVAAGYSPYLQLGENLAIEFYDTDSLISAWMNSPTHRANILQDGFRDQGMGLTFGDPSQNQFHSAIANTFGTLAKAPAPRITRASPPPVVAKIKPRTPKVKAPTKVARAKPGVKGTESSVSITPTLAPERLTTPIQPRSSQAAAQEPLADNSETKINPLPTQLFSEPALIGSPLRVADPVLNRYLILLFGFILFLILAKDARAAFLHKFTSLDKKINNIALLLISLIVITYMYWM